MDDKELYERYQELYNGFRKYAPNNKDKEDPDNTEQQQAPRTWEELKAQWDALTPGWKQREEAEAKKEEVMKTWTPEEMAAYNRMMEKYKNDRSMQTTVMFETILEGSSPIIQEEFMY